MFLADLGLGIAWVSVASQSLPVQNSRCLCKTDAFGGGIGNG